MASAAFAAPKHASAAQGSSAVLRGVVSRRASVVSSVGGMLYWRRDDMRGELRRVIHTGRGARRYAQRAVASGVTGESGNASTEIPVIRKA